ncbi:hypothetical protein K3495_g13661 [Podosphaera aphanis]|nr:hypothetical protein K3495_g13661 [Podosphaera aphanis]
MRLHQPQGPSKLEPKIQGEENYLFIGMQGNSIYKLMHQHLFKGVEPEKPYSNYEIYKDNTHGVQTPLQFQTKKRKAIEAESVITDKNNSKMQCKSSTEAMSKSSPEVFENTVMNRTHLNVRCKPSTGAISKSSPEAISKPSTEAINTPRAHQHDALTQLGGSNCKPLVTTRFGDDAELWVQSLRDELQVLKDTKTYEICKNQLLVGKKLISPKWVCSYKWNPDGTVSWRKTRLVARGFEQSYGSEYLETFATVVRYSTLRTLLAKAATEDLEVDHIDVNTAFLNPNIKQEIYMKIPYLFDLTHPETKSHEHEYYLKLNKSLYGLKQAPREWLLSVNSFFEDLGLISSVSDTNLFCQRQKGVYILLFVDDILIIGHKKDFDDIKAKILRRWKCKDLSPATVFVGFQIERVRASRSLFIHHGMYVGKLLDKLNMQNLNPTQLPIPAGTVLRKDDNDYDCTIEEGKLYRQIVGSAIYLANNTRSDISYAVGQLARFMASPRQRFLHLSKHLLRYINGTRKLGIMYEGDGPNIKYSVFTDATWGTEDDRK